MHGRARVTVSAEAAASAARRAGALRRLTAAALASRGDLLGSGEAAVAAERLSSELLAVNADVYSLWSARRARLRAAAAAAAAAAAGTDAGEAAAESADALLASELRVSAAAIARSPKSYSAWHHRAWALAEWPPRGAGAAAAWRAELALCAQLLAADERNFHCWSYRRWVVQAARRLGAGAEEGAAPADAAAAPFSVAAELDFTAEKIRRNFSNYSAWHCRSVLLLEQAAAALGDAGAGAAPAAAGKSADSSSSANTTATSPTLPAASTPPYLFGNAPVPAAGLPVAVCMLELQLAKRALYTEPDDQSAWFYHRWLVDRLRDAAEANAGAGAATAAAALIDDVSALLDLARAEPASKWPQLGLAHALQAAARGPALLAAATAAATGEVRDLLAPPGGAGPAAAIRRAYAAAGERDPSRAACYTHLAREVGEAALPVAPTA